MAIRKTRNSKTPLAAINSLPLAARPHAKQANTEGQDLYLKLIAALLCLTQGNAEQSRTHLANVKHMADEMDQGYLRYLCATCEAALVQTLGDLKAFQVALARAAALASDVAETDPLPHRMLEDAGSTARVPGGSPMIRITTLGRFGMTVKDAVLDLASLRQRRPLELLKAIIALGGRDVACDRICEALWPEAEGDAAHRNFTIALHRLRKILPVNFIVLRGRNLSIDPKLCHVDLWDLERQLRLLESALLNPETIDADTLSKFGANCGRSFLEGEDAPWAYSARERFRERCLRLVINLARHLHRAGRHVEVIQICRVGLRIDPLTEELYRIEMRCHQSLGETAAAHATFRQCTEILRRELGVEPARETVSLISGVRLG